MNWEGSDAGFGIEANEVGFEAVLTLHGEVDISTAPELGASLDEAIHQGHRFVVLDLAELHFMDGAGLRVIASRAQRLAASGGALTVRSPSALVRRLLDVVGLTDLVRFEDPDIPTERPALPRPLDLSRHLPLLKASALSGYVQRVAAVPSEDAVVNSALRLVVALSKATVGGADGVSVSLRRHGHLSTVSASDQTVLDMDASQYETEEGPCVDASVKGHRFYAEVLETELRWPSFTPRARALGINAILSSPLLVGKEPVGALNIYSRRPSAFAAQDQRLASVFADEASIVLSEAQADVTDHQLDDRLGEALRSRELISQAQGVIMERDGIGEDRAFSTLRRLAVESGQPLRDHARDVLSSALRSRSGGAGAPKAIDP